MRRLPLYAALALLMAAVLWQSQADGGSKSTDQVKAKATATKLDGDRKQNVTITLDIAKGWHIYANPVGNELLEPGQTKVKIAKAKFDVTYPAGKQVVDGKEKYSIYEGSVVLKAEVQRSAGDSGPLEISIAIQACTDKTCLQPGTLKVTVP